MDKVKDQLTNMSLYDVKAYIRKAQNVILSFTEIEAKVREATNNEPWGASSTLMQEISNATHNYQEFNEIMPMIYKRFTEKSAAEWRQIYKALQLLDYIVKNGAESVIDYTRSHLTVIEMLKHFHYIDLNGKDQGINVRNRAKTLIELLNDVQAIRSERKKAKANKSKYGGVSNTAMKLGGVGNSSLTSGFGGSGKKYGGIGSDSFRSGNSDVNSSSFNGQDDFGGYSGGVFGDGGGFGGNDYDGPGYTKNNSNGNEFEEYEVEQTLSNKEPAKSVASTAATGSHRLEGDLFSFDSSPITNNNTQNNNKDDDNDDEFDDFQSAGPAITSAPAPLSTTPTNSMTNQTPTTSSQSNYNDLFGSFTSGSASTKAQPQLPSANVSTQFSRPAFSSGLSSTSSSFVSPPNQASKKSNDVFGDLWSTASSTSKNASKSRDESSKISLANLAQESVKTGIWGDGSKNTNTNNASNAPASSGNLLDDLLL
ncbi:ENTH-domain-containing protein [Nadsonia fulvescens var. elongata DSM 6958]|uniref:ENTH-domain-containing protein n=1 Tax=Nadsonia fulvescens var. elongata DSM 6958 TaxID=857566 RepID=A0A1E3PKV8_9ASCO|nr:ENTH-domain-containing protein [Nadsonia fulvescens var. elongata DSM 6958]